jgi:hypothetical protein
MEGTVPHPEVVSARKLVETSRELLVLARAEDAALRTQIVESVRLVEETRRLLADAHSTNPLIGEANSFVGPPR